MKKTILRVLGLVAVVTLMLYNVQLFANKDDSNISLAALETLAWADGETSNCACGPNQNYEKCRDSECTYQLSVGCTFTYCSEILTTWGYKAKS